MDPRCGVEWCHIAPITGRNIFTNVCTPTIFARIRLQRPTVRNMECFSESGEGRGRSWLRSVARCVRENILENELSLLSFFKTRPDVQPFM